MRLQFWNAAFVRSFFWFRRLLWAFFYYLLVFGWILKNIILFFCAFISISSSQSKQRKLIIHITNSILPTSHFNVRFSLFANPQYLSPLSNYSYLHWLINVFHSSELTECSCPKSRQSDILQEASDQYDSWRILIQRRRKRNRSFIRLPSHLIPPLHPLPSRSLHLRNNLKRRRFRRERNRSSHN